MDAFFGFLLVKFLAAFEVVGCYRGKQDACIVVCDKTRPVPNHLILRKLISKLVDGGIETSNICIVVATGLHEPTQGDDLRNMIGDEWVLDNIKVRRTGREQQQQEGGDAMRRLSKLIVRRFTITRRTTKVRISDWESRREGLPLL